MAAGVLDRVERAHDEACAVADDPDLSVELHVAEAEGLCALLLLLVGLGLLQCRELRLAIQRVVVDLELRVARHHRAVLLDEQRVDLDGHRVGRAEHVVQPARDRGHGVALRLGHAGREAEAARRVGR